MRAAVNAVLVWSAFAAMQAGPLIAFAAEREAQQGESRWVPSLAVTTGVTFQQQQGAQSSLRFDNTDPSVSAPLRPGKDGDDRVVSPFVGAALELMTPALPLLTSPRAFMSAEILPTFGSERLPAVDGDPSRLRGPNVGAVLAGEEDATHYTTERKFGSGPRQVGFSENEANGQGMRTSAQVDNLVFGAKVGVAFAFQLRGRQLRIKPSAGWIHYKVGVKGYLVDPSCDPPGHLGNCTNTYFPDPVDPENNPGTLNEPGFLRESILQGHDSGVFDGVGPGVDLEMDTGRYGPLGTSLFLGVHAYYIPGDRDIYFTASRSFNDQIGNHTDTAAWRTRVAPWLYRAGIGIRFQWLGSPQ